MLGFLRSKSNFYANTKACLSPNGMFITICNFLRLETMKEISTTDQTKLDSFLSTAVTTYCINSIQGMFKTSDGLYIILVK